MKHIPEILAADTDGCLRKYGIDEPFTDLSSLTAFADYRVPQVLTYMGAMSYSDQLMAKLKVQITKLCDFLIVISPHFQPFVS